MKKIIKISFFILLFIFIFYELNTLYKVEVKNYRWYQYLEKIEKNSLDIVFLGNSHNFATVQPQIVEDLLGTNAYTIGVPSESLQTTYYELEELFKSQNPKYIVIETFAIQTLLSNNDDFSYKFINSIPFNATALKKFFNTNIDETYNYFPFVRKHNEFWKYPVETLEYLQIDFDHTKGNYNFTEASGFLSYPIMISEYDINKVKNRESENVELPINHEIDKYLKKIINLCEKNNAQVVLFTISQIKDYLNLPYEKINYQKLSTDYNIPYIDFRDKEYSIFHYADTNHMSFFGSTLLSFELAEELSEIYNLPINKLQYSYYQDLLFTDILLEEIDQDTLLLTLKNQDKDIDYNQYTFNIGTEPNNSDKNQTTYNKNQFEVSKTIDIVDVKISNPILDYDIIQDIKIKIINEYE